MKSKWITFSQPCQYELSRSHRPVPLRGWIIAWRYHPKDTANGWKLQYLTELGEMIVIQDNDELEFIL